MNPTSSTDAGQAASRPPGGALALTQALARLADALETPGAAGDSAHAAAYAAVLNLAGPMFLDARADAIGRLVSQLSADARDRRLFDAWVHFLDQFAGYVLQGEQNAATRYVYALAGVLEGVPAHHHLGHVESTEALSQALSQAVFGRPGCVRVARELQLASAVEPDFFGFLQFYAVRHAQPDGITPEEDSNFSTSAQDDVGWQRLSAEERARRGVPREAVLAVCVQPPHEDPSDYLALQQRLRAWLGGSGQAFALDYVIEGRRHRARLARLEAGPPFSTALHWRHALMLQAVRELAGRAGAAAATRAVVTLVAPAEDLEEGTDAPFVRPGVALFAGDEGRLVAGVQLEAAADVAEQLSVLRDALLECGVASVEFSPTIRPEVARDGQPVFYDPQGGAHAAGGAAA